MKKAFFLLLLPLLMWSCAQDDAPLMPDAEAPAEAIASHIRSAADVLGIAAKAAEMKASTSRSGEVRVDAKSLFAIHANDSRSDSSDPLMYAVDFEDNEGFVIISAPKDVEPILFIADEGNYISNETRQNENFQFFLDNAKDYVQAKSSYGIGTGSGTTPGEDTIKRLYEYDTLLIKMTYSLPRIKVNWNTAWPENMYCSNKNAGCGPVALGQILTYVEKPYNISLTYPEKDKETELLNWKEIKKHEKSDNNINPTNSIIESHLNNCATDNETHKTIGRLIRQIGQSTYTTYSSSKTLTAINHSCTLAKNWLTSDRVTMYNSGSNLFDALYNQDCVAYVCGTDSKTGITHHWVSDAIKFVEYKVNYFELEVLQWSKVESQKYIHHNWGWGGNGNGYALENVFRPVKYNGNGLYTPTYSGNIKFFTVKK